MARKKDHKPLSPAALGLVAARFKLLGEPARLSLLNALMEEAKNVNELVESTGLSQANVSKHLAHLADAGYVHRRKDGLYTVYSIADDSVFQLCDLMCSSIAKKLGQDLKAIA
ncbi:MAG: winged helix-turn-helix transcriptional regulator [Planctomycetes bacterium]|nr:winged helix-turn-helix transcriptional regulator [Planctomycetota bacterium]MCA8917378.1 winged helix-turn-helix transcriptional regulator [Planctomycetota bacterium]